MALTSPFRKLVTLACRPKLHILNSSLSVCSTNLGVINHVGQMCLDRVRVGLRSGICKISINPNMTRVTNTLEIQTLTLFAPW